MKKGKKIFNYKNNLVLINGSSIRITSIKDFKNYQLNVKVFEKKKTAVNNTINQRQSSFLKKII